MEQKKKRYRVSKGHYNQYLKTKNPMEHAPTSSKHFWGIQQKTTTNGPLTLMNNYGTGFDGPSSTGQHLVEQDTEVQDMAGQDTEGQDMIGQEMEGLDMNGQDTEGQVLTRQDMAGQDMTGQDMAGQDMTGQDMAGQDMTGQNTAEQDMMGQDMAGQNMTGQDMTGQNTAEQDMTGQDMAGQDMTGQDMMGEDMVGQDMRGQDMAGQDITGQDTAEQDMTGQDMAGQDMTGQDMAGQDMTGQDMAEQDMMGQDMEEQDFTRQDMTEQDMAWQDITGQDTEGQDMTGQDKDGLETGDQLIYPGARITFGAYMLNTMRLALKLSLTGEGLGLLLEQNYLLCPAGNLISQSLGTFKKWFQKIKTPLKVHDYCSYCHLLISNDAHNTGICPNDKCKNDISKEENLCHFIELPIEDQLKAFFARPSFVSDLKYRFSRKKVSPDSIEDIYDGDIYKSLSCEGGILQNPKNISLLWNTDGIPCFKSSQMSLWPLFFQINELQYHKRCLPENMVLGGLWFGSKKPSVMSYTGPFIQTLRYLETDGFSTQLDDQSTINVKVVVIGGTADLPAKSLVCNSVQFNGKYGCSKCLQPGETCKTSARGHVHIFPFKPDCPDGPHRTHAGTVADICEAIETGKPSNGMKGPCFLQCLGHYNLVSGTCLDYMHGVLLGVTKLLLTLWFSTEHKGKNFSMCQKVDIIDKRLKHLKPPNNITRLPRSIKEHLKYWKASEFRSWLLYYSLPLLRDIQEEEYYQHYLLYVNAIFLLLQEKISIDDLRKAELLLKHFVLMFTAYYEERYMTCNMHQLLHLAKMVKDMGPLWAYSCFPFENMNGNLLQLFHGTQNVDFQIVETVALLQNLPRLEKHYLTQGSQERSLYDKILGNTKRNDRQLQEDFYVVGGTAKQKLNVHQLAAVTDFLGYVPLHYVSFKRLRKGSDVFHSRLYKRASARNSYSVAYSQMDADIGYGQIELYMQLYVFCEQHSQLSNLCGCNSKLNIAVVHPQQKICGEDSKISHDNLTNADVSFITLVKPVQEEVYCVVPIKNILHKCVIVEIKEKPNEIYFCKMPNQCEHD